MNKCPITYEDCNNKKYSEKGLNKLSRSLIIFNDLPFTADEQRQEAAARADKMSIQGIQPKLSAVLSIKNNSFSIVDKEGRFILKPQHIFYPELPQNEDLTMRIAETIGLEVPLHGMVYSKDSSFTYFIKRFDRFGKNRKLPVEDFAQLAGKNRETKYDYSMEKLAGILEKYCTFPAVEKQKLFKLVIFNFIIGNEDMHLKNYSLIRRNNMVELSPVYDLINTTITLKNATEEIALPINGKKSNLNRKTLVDYYGEERLGLNRRSTGNVLFTIQNAIPAWIELIKISFLSKEKKSAYLELIGKRGKRLKW
ncbi:hypothetical protein ES705_14139 [subsurface metagenome]